MGRKELKTIINKYLFVPITDELAEQLHAVADTIAAETGFESASTYVRSSYLNQASPLFKGRVQTLYIEQYGESLQLPALVYAILETYTVMLVMLSEKTSEETKNRISLTARNYSVLRKGNFGRLLCPEWVMQMNDYYAIHGSKQYAESSNYTSLLNAVISKAHWSETGLDILDQNVYDKLRGLCVAVVRGRVSGFVSSATYQNVQSPFAQVYLLVKKMVYEWQWTYISASPVKRVLEVMGEKAGKRKRLCNIVNEVVNETGEDNLVLPKNPSSILLERIKDGRQLFIDSRTFNVLEFGVYLYYEMLSESYKN